MSKVVFVGNVPYTMGEDQLIDVFKQAGEVVGFRLVFDRDTGKPKGYGFCEFKDHETAMSAVRNLNNIDVGGRCLRIDLADSDPFLEGKTTVRGELMDSGDRSSSSGPNSFLASLPPGVPVPHGQTSLDYISQTLANMDQQNKLLDVLAHMKAFIITYPDHARSLLSSHPQYGYALFQALVLKDIIDPSILQRMAAQSIQSRPGPPPPPVIPQPPPTNWYPPPPQQIQPIPPHHLHQPQAQHLPPPHFPQQQQQHHQQHTSLPPPGMGGAYPPQGYPPPPPQAPSSYYRAGPPTGPAAMHNNPNPYQQPPLAPAAAPQPPPAPVGVPDVSAEQRAALMQVLAMTPEQINGLGENERKAVLQLRNQFMGSLGG